MHQFDALLKVAEELNGPSGCPWDIKQTFATLQPYVLEEAHELMEAVDENDDQKMIEELGDLLYTIIFYGKIAEKNHRFTIGDVIERETEKLIRRHPHVFGNQRIQDIEGIVENWEKIKKEEDKNKGRKSPIEGIPKTLPAVAKAQKMVQKLKRTSFPDLPESRNKMDAKTLREQFLHLIAQAEASGLDAESELRRATADLENAFRSWELNE